MKISLPLVILMFFSFWSLAHAENIKSAPTSYEIVENAEQLPELVLALKEALAEAAATGNLEEIRGLFESYELAPIITNEHINDPIKFWKSKSVDGSARDYMAALAEVLSLPPVKTAEGHYIWPYLAKIPLDKLTPPQQIDLFRLVGPKQASEMFKTNSYNYYELMIGKDGTWHEFRKQSKSK